MNALTSPPVKSSAHSPADVPLVQYRDGSVYAMSLTTPGRVYRVTLDPLSCECLGWQHRRHCCHSQAALARFASPCDWCGQFGAQAFVNGVDGDSIIHLCGDCLETGTAPAAWWAALRPVEA